MLIIGMGDRVAAHARLVSASTISTNPHYDLSAISVNTIPTQKLAKEEAISNIKNVLLQGKGIWFAYYLPDKSAWNNFFSFWGTQPESAVWQPDSACGRSFDYQNGGGHAVLCVGYDDTDPNNRYWIMLNSWGNTTGRPAGLFRMNMDMNYDCSYGDIGYAFYWMTLDMSYPQGDPEWSEALSRRHCRRQFAACTSLPSPEAAAPVLCRNLTAIPPQRSIRMAMIFRLPSIGVTAAPRRPRW